MFSTNKYTHIEKIPNLTCPTSPKLITFGVTLHRLEFPSSDRYISAFSFFVKRCKFYFFLGFGIVPVPTTSNIILLYCYYCHFIRQMAFSAVQTLFLLKNRKNTALLIFPTTIVSHIFLFCQ